VRVGDIDVATWTWTVRRQTTPSPGGLVDKGTKGKRARKVPLIAEVRELVTARIAAAGPDPSARLLTGPRGGRITPAVLRDATHWDEVSPRSDSSTFAATICGTPGSRGWPTPGFPCTSCGRSPGTAR
jgi:integrase